MKTTGYIDSNGKYIKGVDKPMGYDVNPTHKQYRHDMERKQFAKEIIQPYKNGRANPEFIKEYPEQSEQYFGKGVIERAQREL